VNIPAVLYRARCLNAARGKFSPAIDPLLTSCHWLIWYGQVSGGQPTGFCIPQSAALWLCQARASTGIQEADIHLVKLMMEARLIDRDGNHYRVSGPKASVEAIILQALRQGAEIELSTDCPHDAIGEGLRWVQPNQGER